VCPPNGTLTPLRFRDSHFVTDLHISCHISGPSIPTTLVLHPFEPDEKARQWENEIDGKLVLETTNRTMDPEEVVRQYKELQDVERCFRTLKSSLDIRPMHHWVDRRIEAHIFICVLALQIQRVMRQRLRRVNIRARPRWCSRNSHGSGPSRPMPTAENSRA